MRKDTLIGVALCVSLALGLPVQGQDGPQARSKAEYDAYLALYNETDPQTKADLGEMFLEDFPESDFLSLAFMNLISAYETSQEWALVMDASDRFQTMITDPDVDSRRYIYPRAIVAAQLVNDIAKVVQFGDLLLEVDPGNLGAMLTIATAITDNIPTEEPARGRALERAYTLALRARSQAQQYYSTGTDEGNAERVQVDTRIRTALAHVYYAREDYESAAAQWVEIIRLSPRNGNAYYRLGDCYQFLAAGASREVEETLAAEAAARDQNADPATLDRLTTRYEQMQDLVLAYMDRAIDSFATATAIGGTVGATARERLETLYRVRNEESTDGLEELIEQKRDELSGG